MQKNEETFQQLVDNLKRIIKRHDLEGFKATVAEISQLSRSGQPHTLNVFETVIDEKFLEAFNYLLSDEYPCNAPNFRCETSQLHDAINNKSIMDLMSALQSLDPILGKRTTPYSLNLFPLLIKKGFLEGLRALLENRLGNYQHFRLRSISSLVEPANSPFLLACQESNLPMMELLLEFVTSVPRISLDKLVEAGDSENLRYFFDVLRPKFKSLHNIDIYNSEVKVPLVWSALCTGKIECAKILLSQGALLNQHNNNGWNLFHAIIDAGCKDALIWLLSPNFKEEFPDVSLPDINEGLGNHRSLIILTQLLGLPEFTEILLTYGFDHGLNCVGKTNGSHATEGNYTLNSGGYVQYNNCVSTARGLYFQGIIIFPNFLPGDVIDFFKDHGIHIRIHRDTIIMSGSFKINRKICNDFLVQKYGNIASAYLCQAKHSQQLYQEDKNPKYLAIIEDLLLPGFKIAWINPEAFKVDMSIVQTIQACLLLGDSFYFRNKATEAKLWYLKALSLSQICDVKLFTSEHRARLSGCSNIPKNALKILMENNRKLTIASEVTNQSYTSYGQFNLCGIILRDDSDSLEKSFFGEWGVSVSLKKHHQIPVLADNLFKMDPEQDVLCTEGDVSVITFDSVLNFMTHKHGNFESYCLEEGISCLNHYYRSHFILDRSFELDSAEWFLTLCTNTTQNTTLKIKAYLNLISVALAKNDHYSAIAYIQLTLAEIKNRTFDKGIFNVLQEEIAKYQYLPVAINALHASEILDVEMLKKLFDFPLHAMTINAALPSLKKADILTTENIQEILQSPAEALWIAQRLGGKPQSTDPVIRDFIKIRENARLLLLGNHAGPAPENSRSSFFGMPADVKARILSFTHSGSLSKPAAIRIALQALSENEDDSTNRFLYRI